jgi:hypothetical protein
LELIDNIKLKAGNRNLTRRLVHFKRTRESHNFQTAKTAGILFTPTDTISFEQIKQFLSYLNGYKLEIYVLGYIDSKIIPESFLFWKGINLFSKKDLNWNLVPKTILASDFIEKPFDLLFNLSLSDYFPVEYIARLSKSKFKIGRFNENNNCYDLMFDLEEDSKLDSYLETIKHYLALINN